LNPISIRIEQVNCVVGDIRGNVSLILDCLASAQAADVDLLVLPELVVCGYPPMDLLERRSFRERIYEANTTIAQATSVGKTALIFGSVTPNEGPGRRIFNAALLADGGQITHTVYKTLLPTYDIFDEFRYFEPNTAFAPVDFRGTRLGITICEDIWNNQNEIIYHVYDVNPAAILREMGAEVLVNVSASPFSKGKAPIRLTMLQRHARELEMPIIYANQVGANTEVIFDGDSMALQADGTVSATTVMFEASYTDVVWHPADRALKAVSPQQPARDLPLEERFFKALVLGLRDYLQKSGMPQKVILGLSGGIDSALVAAIAAEAVGAGRVTGLTMPSEFSSPGSVHDSVALAQNLGIQVHEVSIRSLYDTFGQTLDPFFQGTAFNVAEENLQSRIRGVILMAMSNKFGHILLNTGNKSEMAVGYCTLYGDMAGGLSVISDLYKTEVYQLSRWLNDSWYKREVIPWNTIVKPPSAELRPDQKDSDSLPEYDVLDPILRMYIEEQCSRAEIVSAGFDRDMVERVVRLVDLNEYKRRQSPPGLRMSAKAFGIGRRLPIVQQWTTQSG
jgi:NAD+ synthase (glutamine-hydrolysing)